jgi:hypothetical protein
LNHPSSILGATFDSTTDTRYASQRYLENFKKIIGFRQLLGECLSYKKPARIVHGYILFIIFANFPGVRPVRFFNAFASDFGFTRGANYYGEYDYDK